MDDQLPAPGDGLDIDGQGLSDAEQTLADRDQTASDTDQTDSDRDQAAAEQDQAVSDREVDQGADPAGHAGATAARAEAARERAETSRRRDDSADERESSARQRDELSSERDGLADERDKQAEALDARDELSDRHTLRMDELRGRAQRARSRAAQDRDKAALDRRQAARDREEAVAEHDRFTQELAEAGTDSLTGVRTRGVGLEQLEHEISRARREGTALVAAYVDVDELKSVNDRQGHAAGDALLQTIALGLRHHMRPYDLVVRLGGDEFLCVMPVTAATARDRFGELRSELAQSGAGSVSVGFSELREGDSRDDLIARADHELMTQKEIKRVGGNGSGPSE